MRGPPPRRRLRPTRPGLTISGRRPPRPTRTRTLDPSYERDSHGRDTGTELLRGRGRGGDVSPPHAPVLPWRCRGSDAAGGLSEQGSGPCRGAPAALPYPVLGRSGYL